MFTIEYVKNLKWCDSNKTMFSCIVKYAEFNEEMPSGINATDTYAHIQEIWVKGNAGEYGIIEEYVEPPIIPAVIPDLAPNQEQVSEGTQDL
jgi:hypothetical protein